MVPLAKLSNLQEGISLSSKKNDEFVVQEKWDDANCDLNEDNKA